jgi:predicted transposase/invertase (TIGR01784 family)
LELHTIELKKFSKDGDEDLGDLVAKITNSLDMWVAFLTRHDLLNEEHLPPALNTPALKKAIHVLDVMNFASDERDAYEEHLKWLRIEASTLKKYEAKGFSEGKAEGKAEGKVEGKMEVAKSMIRKGWPPEEICEMTGLPLASVVGLSS